jgi:hypothetical protein
MPYGSTKKPKKKKGTKYTMRASGQADALEGANLKEVKERTGQ